MVATLIEQNKELLNKNMELTDKNTKLADKILEALQPQNVSTFNLNFYVNNIDTEQLNTGGFINSIKHELENLECLDKPIDDHVSNIITKQLEYLDTYSNVKREPSYMKSDNSWIKK